ncbi:hypothetical protein [Hyphomicrobium sp. CS1GBMeth3]|uniref:hypothetical protein n=1 Tax=Hyphomicrobium sp. CS1GBMeth3 TaxID=1892845 RepID=UPI000931C450|nr:hypothetical protein [Hyphomicrobium sp. CS1GBMeth3]
MHQIVPKASAVADTLHRLVPESPATFPATLNVVPAALVCPHTGAACPALSRLFSHLTPAGDDACAWLRALAPCGQCRTAFEGGHDSLRRLRLGQREREILIAAATAGAPLAVTEPGMSRSLSAARRRAALSLSRAGLTAPHEGGRAPRATIVLTELGRYVMSAYGRFITAGKPVRWTRPARGVALPGRDPAELVAETLACTEGALRGTLDELKRVLLAAIGGRFQDPARLDEVTRHLERKATLLRAVLEPQRAAQA